MADLKAKTYAEFWPLYLGEHRKPATRACHFVGTGLGLAILAWAIVSQTWWALLAALVSGYAFAWASHAFIERNKPATFTYPLWSFLSDFRMFFLWLGGKLEAELARHGIKAEQTPPA